MQDLDRVRAMTKNYFLWQGLRLVPFGAFGCLLRGRAPRARVVAFE